VLRLLDVDDDVSGGHVGVLALPAAALPTQSELVVFLQGTQLNVFLGRRHVALLHLEPVRVCIALQLGSEGGSQLLLQQSFPIKSEKPTVLLHFLRSLAAQPLLRVFSEQQLQEVPEDGVADEVERRFFLANASLGALKLLVLLEEGRKADHHLEDQVAQGPPIAESAQVHSLPPKNLRGQVLGSACDEVCACELVVVAAESEIDQLGVALGVDEHVFGLEAAWGREYSL